MNKIYNSSLVLKTRLKKLAFKFLRLIFEAPVKETPAPVTQ